MILLILEIILSILGINAIRTSRYRLDATTTATGKAARTAGLLHVLIIPAVLVICFATGAIAAIAGQDVASPEWAWIFSAIEWAIVIGLIVAARKIARRGEIATPAAAAKET